MSGHPISAKAAIIPTMRYRNAGVMIDWLCRAFGFERQLVVQGRDGEPVLAQLRFGESLVMVNPIHESTIDKHMTQPDEVGGFETQSCYILVADLDGHRARAKAAGAEILFDIDIMFDTSRNRGGRGYACRDPEGHIWSFGTYDPWQGEAPRRPQMDRRRRGRWVLAGGVLAVAVLSVLAAWPGHYPATLAILRAVSPQRAERQVARARETITDHDADLEARIAEERRAREVAERSATELQLEIAVERAARDAAQRAAGDLEDRLTRERRAHESAGRSTETAARGLEDERAGRAAAERLAKDASERQARESSMRLMAERQAQEARERLAPERNARVAAELAANELRNELMQVRQSESRERFRELRDQLEGERNAKAAAEEAARLAHNQLIQEKSRREAAERALRQVQDQISAAPAPLSCWAMPDALAASQGSCRQPQ